MSTIDLSNVSLNGHGLMSMTALAKPVPIDEAIAAMKRGVELNLPQHTFFNGGEFYGKDNMTYIKTFFDKYPGLRKHVIVSIKGCTKANFKPDNSKEGVEKSIANITKNAGEFDIFEPGRIDPSVPLEETISAMDDAVDEGKIKAYTLSEVGAKTLGKAYEIAKHKPVGVEVEFSILTQNIKQNGLAKLAGDLNVPIIAYSPIGMGLLSGKITSKKDVADFRSRFDRFSDDNLNKNKPIFDALQALGAKKNATAAQIALAWVKYHSGKIVDGIKFPKVVHIASSSRVSRVEENFADVELTDAEFAELQDTLKTHTIHGARYMSGAPFLEG